MSSGSHSGPGVHKDCTNLDQGQFRTKREEIKRMQCRKVDMEFRRLWWFIWHRDLVFQIKEKPDVVIVSYHENGVDRLLCSKNQFEEKKQSLYDPSQRIPIYNLDETPNTFIRIGDFWEMIENIGCSEKNKYDMLWNNCHDKAKQFNFYLQQKLANQLELQIDLLRQQLQIVEKKKK